ncbi:MAG: DnaB-like helicase C-terminal domain-containing protein [Anaerolineaceae bacterium]|nr:DnaB-like helicase C-terminal domain-containing protein [Anaerolineaceae bacterium]
MNNPEELSGMRSIDYFEPLGVVAKRVFEQIKEKARSHNADSKNIEITMMQNVLLTDTPVSKPSMAGNSSSPERTTRIPTGFVDLDNEESGFHAGELIVIGARPAMGKISFSLNIARYTSIEKKKKVAVFSQKLSREHIALRVLCSDALADIQRVQQGAMTADEWTKISKSMARAMTAPMYIDNTTGITTAQLRSRCLSLKIAHGLDMILVADLELMRSGTMAENRHMDNSEIIHQLKAIAQELNVPVMACIQLKRAGADRPDHRPRLSDLPDYQSIGKDADVISLLYREGYYNRFVEDRNIIELIIAKDHGRSPRTVMLYWLAEYALFANLIMDSPSTPVLPEH